MSLIRCRLELDEKARRKAATDDGECDVVPFSYEKWPVSCLIDGSNRPGILQSPANNFSTTVARERRHGIISTNNSLSKISANVMDNAVIGTWHLSPRVPVEEIVETSSVVDRSPGGIRIGESRVTVHTIPEASARVETHDLLLKKLKMSIILDRNDGRSLFFTELESVSESHCGGCTFVLAQAGGDGEVLEAVTTEPNPTFGAHVEEEEGRSARAASQGHGVRRRELLGA